MSDREKELAAELAAINARRAARVAEREARRAAGETEAKIAEAKRLDALEEALVGSEADHGPLGKGVAVVHCRYADGTLLGSVIVKRPQAAYWTRFQGALADLKGDRRDEKIQELWRHARVWPEIGAVEALVRELPNTPVRLMNAIALLAGEHIEEVSGKS